MPDMMIRREFLSAASLHVKEGARHDDDSTVPISCLGAKAKAKGHSNEVATRSNSEKVQL